MKDKLMEAILKVAEKLQTNRYMSAIRNAFTALLPITICGAFSVLFTSVICTPNEQGISLANFEIFRWLENLNPMFDAAYYATLNFLTIGLVVLIAIELGKQYGIQQDMTLPLVALSCYVTLCATTMIVTNDQGISFDVADVLAVKYTNAQGLFMAMISSILSGEIYIRLVKGGKMRISLPETVPSNVANAFNVLIPGVVTIFIISGIYLFLSTIYYLEQFGCLPFQSTNHVITTMNTSSLIAVLLSYPILTMIGIIAVAFIILAILDKKHAIKQDLDLHWNIDNLNQLPHPSHYPNHTIETIFMIVFIIFFIIYALFFSSDLIIKVQHESYQMIHMMTYFFQPFIMIIIFDYFIDMTKKIYTKKYLQYSSIINLFTIISLSIFVVNSSFLKDYLLPYNMDFEYMLINGFIITALCFIYFISLYKLFRNIKSYRFLFKK